MMMSSKTSAPLSITFFAASPRGVPAFTAARSMSPVEICGMPNASLMNAACVPLPAPGGPSSINRIVDSRPLRRTRSIAHVSAGVECARALEVGRRIDAGGRRAGGDFDDDPVAVPKRSQLLERFETFDRRARERRIAGEKIDPIGVEPVVAVERDAGRQCPYRRCERLARPRNRRATEIKRVVAM